MSVNRSNLKPVDEALALILAQSRPLAGIVELPLSEALGAVLAEAQSAAVDVPAHDNSAMDGYALNTADLAGDSPALPVSQRIAAGDAPAGLAPGTAARIFTGAPIPPGADAVVIQEDTRLEADRVVILEKPAPGANVRLRGHDVARGEEVLAAGHRLQPQDLGLLASLGLERVRAHAPLTVAVLTTGDEVVPPGRELRAGQLYDSNSYTLEGMLRKLGMRCLRCGIVADDPAATREALAKAAAAADCIITTDGVSVGEEDHVKAAVEALGELSLWKLAIKPGKPFSFGRIGDTPFFGLPGNPVAVFVTFAVLVRPCLLRMQGAADQALPEYAVAAGFDIARPGSRQEYIRVRLIRGPGGEAALKAYPQQGSSILTSLSWADGMAVVPAGAAVARGDRLRYIPFHALW